MKISKDRKLLNETRLTYQQYANLAAKVISNQNLDRNMKRVISKRLSQLLSIINQNVSTLESHKIGTRDEIIDLLK